MKDFTENIIHYQN